MGTVFWGCRAGSPCCLLARVEMHRLPSVMTDSTPVRRRWPALVALVLLGLLLTGLLSRGTARGDEGAAIMFASWVKDHGWIATLRGPGGELVAHRLFWVIEKYLLDGFLALLLPAWLYGKALVHDAVLTMDGSLFMLAAAATGWLFVERRQGERVATLAIAALMLGSSAVSFFCGGTIECMMFLFVTVLTVTLHDRPDLSWRHFAVMLAAGTCLILCKPYALAFLLCVALLIPDRRILLAFGAALLLATAAWLLIPAAIGHEGGAMTYYSHVASIKSLLMILRRVWGQLVSFGYGLVWTFPLLALVLPVWRSHRRALLVKAAAIFVLLLVFALFPFPYGEGAIAGPRYPAPFLMVFLPEIADGIAALRRSRPAVLLAVPLSVLLFLPAMDYRNSLVTRWLDLPLEAIDWVPNDNVLLQPGLFAWRIVAAQETHQAVFRPSPEIAYDVPVKAIFPMSGLSRIVYVLENAAQLDDSRPLTLTGWLWRHGLAAPLLWRALRLVLFALLMGWVLRAAWPVRRRPVLTVAT